MVLFHHIPHAVNQYKSIISQWLRKRNTTRQCLSSHLVVTHMEILARPNRLEVTDCRQLDQRNRSNLL